MFRTQQAPPSWPDAAVFHTDGRSQTTSDSYRAILSWANAGFVHRLANITGLDRIGIPCWTSIRPSALHPDIVVCSGKGTTHQAAILSALYEAHERWAAENLPDYLPPDWSHPADDRSVALIPATNLTTRFKEALPIGRVVFPVSAKTEFAGDVWPDTTGLASSSSLSEAILNGLLECAERAATCVMTPNSGERLAYPTGNTRVDTLLMQMIRTGVEPCLVWLQRAENLHVFYCLTRDRELPAPALFCSGAGAHVCPELAALRAVTEAAQSRAGLIAGLREDLNRTVKMLDEMDLDAWRARFDAWFSRPSKHIELIATPPQGRVHDAGLAVWEAVTKKYKVGRGLVADLSRWPNIYCVRVYVEGLQVSTRKRHSNDR